MEIAIPILTASVAVLAVIQGWEMISALRKKRNGEVSDNLGHSNPEGLFRKMDTMLGKLGDMATTLSNIEQRLGDCWEKLKGD